MIRKFTVHLTKEQEETLLELVTRGTAGARPIRRAHTLLMAWEGHTDEEIAKIVRCCTDTVRKTRRRFTERGLDSLYDKPRPGRQRRLDGHAEAHLVALACSDPPAGRSTWTLSLLADQLVALNVVDSVSRDTVRRVLKNRKSSHG